MTRHWPKDIRAVAFDLDGLIFNTEQIYVEVGSTILRRRDKELTKELVDAMMGLPNLKALQVMVDWHQLSSTSQELLDETGELFNKLLPTHLRPMPGLLSLLDYLDTHSIPKAICTSSTPQLVELTLDTASLRDRFDFWLTSEDVERGKPCPDIYLMAMERFRVPGDSMLVLEDSQVGCQAGVASGACTVAVPGDHSRQHDFTGTALVADTLRDRRIYEILAT